MLSSLFPDIFPIVDSAPLLALIMITISVGFMLQKFKFFKNAGIVFTVVLLGIVMTNIGITPLPPMSTAPSSPTAPPSASA